MLLFNLATTPTVTIGIVSLYAALLSSSSPARRSSYRTRTCAKQLGRDTSTRDYATLAWFVASFATIAGALGSALESDAAVREAAYAGAPLREDVDVERTE